MKYLDGFSAVIGVIVSVTLLWDLWNYLVLFSHTAEHHL